MDNNVISSFFSGLYKEETMRFIAEVIDESPIISVITCIEALSWVNSDKKKEAIVKAFVNDAKILPLSPKVCLNALKYVEVER